MNSNCSLKFPNQDFRSGVLSLSILLFSWWILLPIHMMHYGVSLHSNSFQLENHTTLSKTEATFTNLPCKHSTKVLDQTCFALSIWNDTQFFKLSHHDILRNQGFPNQLFQTSESHLIPICLLGRCFPRGPPHFSFLN